jgi:uncharacterized membrane protein
VGGVGEGGGRDWYEGNKKMRFKRTAKLILNSIGSLILLPILLSCTRQPVHQGPQVAGTDVVIDAAALKTEVPEFYTYHLEGKSINFFVLRMQDKVLSFLDACTSCYHRKRGYRAGDGKVSCRDCNMTYALYKLEKGLGGCYPIKLEGRTKNGKYFISLSSLKAVSDKF